MKTGVLAAALACSLVFAMPGGAVTGGTAVSPAPSWAADIVVMHHKSVSVCSGAVVAQSWVLTAAQCVAEATANPCKFGSPYPAKDFRVYVGQTSVKVTVKVKHMRKHKAKGKGKHKGKAKNARRHKSKGKTYTVTTISATGPAYKVASVSRNANSSVLADGQCVMQNDVALLHLVTPTTSTPLWIAPSQSAVADGTSAALYGYGQTVTKKTKSAGLLYRTNDGDWTIDTQCDLASLISATCVDKKGTSAGSSGDIGGPWTMTVDGQPVEALVYSGDDTAKGFAYGTSVAQASIGPWLRATVGIPNVAPGSIVHDTVSGNSWFIDPQGYRRPIPDAGTYSCLVAKGDHVVDLPAAAIQMMAARTISASCIAPGNRVLIAGAGDGGWTGPNDDIASLLTSAGYQVTESATLPADLRSFNEIWWVDTSAPSSAEQSQLVAFEGSGGGVFLTGERPCCETLNAADTSMINAMVTGGGVTAGGQGSICTCTMAMPVNPNLVPDLLQHPFVVDHWTPSQPGGMAGVPDTSVIAYYQPGDISTRRAVAAAWDRPSLVGKGRLVVFMDINWSEAGWRDMNWTDVAQNVAFYLSGLSDLPGPPV